jgi:hypothetical protein
MGKFSTVFAIGFALFAALGGSALIYIAFSELFRRKPMEATTLASRKIKRASIMSLWK